MCTKQKNATPDGCLLDMKSVTHSCRSCYYQTNAKVKSVCNETWRPCEWRRVGRLSGRHSAMCDITAMSFITAAVTPAPTETRPEVIQDRTQLRENLTTTCFKPLERYLLSDLLIDSFVPNKDGLFISSSLLLRSSHGSPLAPHHRLGDAGGGSAVTASIGLSGEWIFFVSQHHVWFSAL